VQRTTQRQLDCKLADLNRVLGRPEASYKREGDKFTALIGNFHFDQSYGGWMLCEMCTEGGGIHSRSPRLSKSQMWDYLDAMIKGVELASHNE
jgi:hypothetical protein